MAMTRAAKNTQLSALVNQFSDPFAFVRELVQNAIDAGSNEVDVHVDYSADDELMTISVTDYGIGMDRDTIETRLTRMFSSAKDGDLTKIGRFGIGFVSVFALEPNLVSVDTARSGEAWHLVIHPELNYELYQAEEVIEGTRVRIYKYCDRDEFNHSIRNVKRSLTAWCSFVEPEVRFNDEPINADFRTLSECQVCVEQDGATIVVGVVRRKQGEASYFNRGLALWRRHDHTAPYVSYRIDSPRLEHTLTRDQILQDDHFVVLDGIAQKLAREELVRQIFSQLERHLLGDKSPELAPLNILVDAAQGQLPLLMMNRELMNWVGKRRVFASLHGEPMSIEEVTHASNQLQLVVADDRSLVTELLRPKGYSILNRRHPSRRMLAALRLKNGTPRSVDEQFCTALPVPTEAVDAAPQELKRLQRQTLKRAFDSLSGGQFQLHFGSLSYEGSAISQWPAIRQSAPFGVSRIQGGGRTAEGKHIVANVEHPEVRKLLRLAPQEPEVSAAFLSQLCRACCSLGAVSSADVARSALEARWVRRSA